MTIPAIWQRIPVPKSVLIRLGVIAGLMVGLMGIGLLISRGKAELVLIAMAAPPVVLLGLSQIEYGILTIVLTAAFVRFSLPTGTQSRIVASLVMTVVSIAIWLSKMLIIDKKLRLQPSRTNIPLLGFTAVTVISYVWSNAFRDVLVMVWSSWPFVQIGALAVMTLLPGAFLLTANCLKEVKWIAWLTVVFILAGTIAISTYYLRLPADFLQVRPLFPTWFICLAYAQALFNRRLPLLLRLTLLILAGVWFYRVFGQQISWLSAWMPTVAAVAVISFFRSRKLLIVIAILLVAYVVVNLGFFETKFDEEASVSGWTRLDAWEHNWRVTGEHLLFGVGPAGYAVYYMSYFPAEGMATHSNYIDILSQTGIVGLFFFLCFFLSLFGVNWDLVKRVQGRSDFVEAFSVGAMGGYIGVVAAMGLGDWIVPFVYTQTIAGFDNAVYTWVLLGAMVSLYHIIVKREK